MESVWAGIIGAMVGSGITLIGEWLHFKHNRGEQQRVAAMQILSQLQLWLIETMNVFYKASYAQPTDDMAPDRDVFPAPGDIPPFPFDGSSLVTISLLPGSDAQNLFDVISRRRYAEMAAEHIAFQQDNEQAVEIFEARIAGLYVECVEIYAKLAKKIGWSASAVSEKGIDSMREKAANLNEILNRPSDVVMD